MSDNDFNMQVSNKGEAENELSSGGGPGGTSKYEPVAQKYTEIDEDEAIVLRDMSQNDVQNLRNLLYRRFGKEDVIVRSSQQSDGDYKAVVRDRVNGEYLRDDEDDSPTKSAPKSKSEGESQTDEDLPDDVDDVF